MLLAKKIKIEVSKQDAATLEFMQDKCRALYNWWVMNLRSGERWPGWRKAKKTLRASRQYDPELNAVYGKLLHEVYFRLDKAMQDFFQRVHNGEKKADFPRFKPRYQFFTLCYPATYLDKLRSKRDKCKKKSRRYLHLSRVSKHVSERKRRKQQDCLHKASHLIAHRLAERAVVIGDLSQRQMVSKKQEGETPKEQRKRRIRNRLVYNDWGLSRFVQMLTYKCERFGKDLHIIDERETTKTCHACKHKQVMPLWQRTYRCKNCDLVMDRDDNSAVNIYERFLAGLPPHTSVI